MGRPIWVTKAGDLGVIAEREFYNLRFDVIDPDNEPLTFSIVGGTLPRGLSLKDDGFIEGIPTVRKVFLRGVPTDVSEDVTSTFAVRVRTQTGEVSDRTFTLTVSGQDVPQLLTPAEQLGLVYDGEYFEYQLSAVDLDDETLTWFIKDGALPPGLTLDSATGLISGYVGIAIDEEYGVAGWTITEWDTRPWDFLVQTIDKNYQFTVGITDGKDFAIRTYTIYVISNDSIDEDGDGVTEELAVRRRPVLLNKAGDLGIFLHDNYFSYKFDGFDFDGDPVQYSVISDNPVALPPNLTIGQDTGWLYGYIEPQALLEKEYIFSVIVNKRNYPQWESDPKEFKITITGDLGKYINWITDTDLGTIENGAVSEFSVEATNGLGRTLYYRLADNFGSRYVEYTRTFTADNSTTQFDLGIDVVSRPVRVYFGSHMYEDPATGTLIRRGTRLVDESKYTKFGVGGIQNFIEFNDPPPVENIRFVLDFGFDSAELLYSGDGVQTEFSLVPFADIDVYIDDQLLDEEYYDADSVTGTVIFKFPPSAPETEIYVEIDTGSVTSIGSAGRLPQGLRLERDGTITGRVTFNGFTFDGGTTTFDVIPRRTSNFVGETTFDQQYRFTVTAYDLEGDIETNKEFVIRLDLANGVPYDDLYGIALLSLNERNNIEQLLLDEAYFPSTDIYRPEDEYFGVTSDLRMLLASGIYPTDAATLQNALETNHYNKRIYLGDIKTARALNSDGTVRYEVVYLEVLDTLVTETGQSISSEIPLGNISISGGFDPVIYPNSLINMRNAIYSSVTQVRKNALPAWMLSKQENGTVLGFIPAVVLCYTKPGKSKAIAFNLSRNNQVNFSDYEVILDRYIWDCNMSQYYDPDSRKFTTSAETTFDKFSLDPTRYALIATVDFAVELAYSQINGRSVNEVAKLGGFDGITTSIFGKTLIFFKQENYDGLNPGEIGWENYTDRFDTSSFDTEVFDKMSIVPGYYDSVNMRGGVWRIIDLGGGVIGLDLITQVGDYGRIDVRVGGVKYGGKRTFYDPVPVVVDGETQPAYRLLSDAVLGEQTTFDDNGTRFFQYKDEYADPDVGDKYMKFPQIGVFE